MIKLLLLALFFFVAYSFIQALFPTRRNPGQPKNRSRDGEQMVQDPQCGTYLPISDAVSATIRGKQHHFCSRKCRSLYKKQH